MIDLAMVGIASMCEVQRSMLEKAGVSLSLLVAK